MKAIDLFNAGDLSGALEAAFAEVRDHPEGAPARWILVELLAFRNDLERADKQVDILATQDAEIAVQATLVRRLLRSAQARLDFMEKGHAPKLLSDEPGAVRDLLEAALALREGRLADAAEQCRKMEENRRRLAGEVDGSAFDDMRDLDDLFAPALEMVMTDDDYRLVPFSEIRSLHFKPIVRVRDVLWRHATLVLRNDAEFEGFVPAIYLGTPVDDDALLLGRSTEWNEVHEGLVRGQGQRMLLFGEEARPIHEIEKVTFATPQPGASS